MYLSINRFTGDGTTTQWEFNFSGGYIDQSHVKVLVTDTLGNETVPAYTWVGPNTISIVPAVAAGYELEVYRDTPKNLPLVDYTDGAIVSEKNLDTTAEQTVFATAEVFDRFTDVAALNETAVADSAEALALATSASNDVQQALTDSANAVAAVAGAITAADNATAAAGAANNAAAVATQAAVDAEATAASALLVAQDAETVALNIDAKATQALNTSDAANASATTALSTTNTHVARTDNPHSTTKAHVGLGNADNTSDANKPVSIAQQAALDLKVSKDSNTGAAELPAGSTAQRPAGATGKLRFNTTLNQFEGHNGSAWGTVGGGATGAPGNYVFNLNDQNVTGDYTIPAGKNAVTAGPITVNAGVTVTVSDGVTWTIV